MPSVEYYREDKKKEKKITAITSLMRRTHHIYPDANHVMNPIM